MRPARMLGSRPWWSDAGSRAPTFRGLTGIRRNPDEPLLQHLPRGPSRGRALRRSRRARRGRRRRPRTVRRSILDPERSPVDTAERRPERAIVSAADGRADRPADRRSGRRPDHGRSRQPHRPRRRRSSSTTRPASSTERSPASPATACRSAGSTSRSRTSTRRRSASYGSACRATSRSELSISEDDGTYHLGFVQAAPPANSDAVGYDRILVLRFDTDVNADDVEVTFDEAAASAG